MTFLIGEEATSRRIPRLEIGGPVRAGSIVVLAFFGFGVGTAAMAPIDNGVGMPGTIIVESRVKPVQHERGGTVAAVLVAEGQKVAAGDVIARLDTASLHAQLTALEAQGDAARRQLALAKQEAHTMSELLDRKLASRSRVLGLERQVAEIEKEAAGLDARVAIAKRDIARSDVRAPEAGRILSLAVKGAGGVLQPGATAAEIVPDDDRLVIEGKLQPNQIENIRPGMPAKVWLAALSWREQRPLAATLAWISPDSVEDRRTGAAHFIARVELNQPRSQIEQSIALQPGMRSEVLLLSGERTLLDQLIDPLMRNINRAFRG